MGPMHLGWAGVAAGGRDGVYAPQLAEGDVGILGEGEAAEVGGVGGGVGGGEMTGGRAQQGITSRPLWKILGETCC